MSQDAEISSSKNHLQSFARNLVEELSDMENELLDTRSFNQASDSSKGNIQVRYKLTNPCNYCQKAKAKK